MAPDRASPSNDSDDKLFKKYESWIQNRTRRKMRQETELYKQYLNGIIPPNLNTPLRINSITIDGTDKTRETFLRDIIHPSLSREVPQTFENVLTQTRRIGSVLQDADIFKVVEARIAARGGVPRKVEDVDIVFRTEERGRFFLKTATEVGDYDANASLTGRMRNVFGGAEVLEGNLALGRTVRKSFNASFSVPFPPDLQRRVEVSAYGLERDNKHFASCMEGLLGVKAAFKMGAIETGLFELAYNNVHRTIRDLTPTASFSIREAAGLSRKSSVTPSWTYDSRDDRIAPSRGFHAKILTELAGTNLGGDTSFAKGEVDVGLGRRLSWLGLPGASFSVSARGGALWSLDTGEKTCFSDRYHLGGPLNVRGFRLCGMGPRDGADSTGATLYYAFGASLMSNIPRVPDWLKVHGWVNGGRLDHLDHADPLKNMMKHGPSLTVGAGLIFSHFSPVRVEINFGVPIWTSRGERPRKGIEVGFGLDFL